MEFRKLKASEIEARVATVKEGKGMSLLLYKDARVDQNILDETVGAENWERKHELIGNNLYCTVSIWVESRKAWVSKQDVGTESKTEAEKGQASDSFKRACFNWGIGRELYTAPFIWINEQEGINKYTKFDVTQIEYDEDGNICKVAIATDKGKPVYSWQHVSRDSMLKAIYRKYPQGSDNLSALLNTFEVDSLEDATESQLQAVYNKCKKSAVTKTK